MTRTGFIHTFSPEEEAAWVARMQHGAQQRAEAPVAQAGDAEPKPAPVAAPPETPRWQEMSEHELIALGAIVGIQEAEGGEFEGVDEDRFYRSLGNEGWDDAEVMSTLNSLRREGYAAPYADNGRWAPSGTGIAVLNDWRRSRERAS